MALPPRDVQVLKTQLVPIHPHSKESKSLHHHTSKREPATKNFVKSQKSL